MTGKIFCGLCGTSMCGVSGTSSTGAKHRYYHCRAAKTKRTCDKKRILKEFVEAAVVDIAMQLFDNTPLLDRVIDNCFELQTKKSASLPALKSQLAQTIKEIDNVMNAIKQGIITPTTKETLLKLEHDKETFEISIAKERIERPVLEKKQIKYWICKFGATNLDDADEKQRLIDVFVNSVYVYHDKMVITFNYQDGDKFVTFDEINEMLAKKENSQNNNSSESSPLSLTGDP